MRQNNTPIRTQSFLVVLQVFLGIILVFHNGHSQIDAFAFTSGRTTFGAVNLAFTREFTTAVTATAPKQHSRVIMHGFLDGLFGGGDDSKAEGNDAILATIDVRTFDANDDGITVGFDSLSEYITNKWMDLFETKSISLTTPVKVFKRSNGKDDESSDSETETIADSANCRLVFQKIDTGYKADEDYKDKDDDTKDKKKKEEVKQGGVEILVQKVVSAKTDKQSLRVIARRCEVDEDTMIKEMSEEIIIKELQQAIAVWKKEATV